jgi:hypothetical protein
MGKKISSLPIPGICYWNVDIESVGWCFQDGRFISDNGQCSYEGMHCLKNGDHLTVFSKEDSKSVIWSGIIDLASNEGHGVSQNGIELKVWAEWFRKEYPAELISAKKKRKRSWR